MSFLEYFQDNFLTLFYGFAFYYPLFMSYLWMVGAVYYYNHWEKRLSVSHEEVPELPEYPGVSILIPCFNEEDNVRETIHHLLDVEYPDYEVIAINDGSSDKTAEILDELAEKNEKMRVVHLTTNQGKAMALRAGVMASPHEYLICVDGDAILDPHAVTWMMRHLLTGSRVGAVTGNPRIRTRSTLLGKIQVGEFSSIIGLIKRAQRMYGRIFTVSGVVAGFRKTALLRVGFWSMDTMTEDIDISWKLQLKHWDIRFEPNALCWILAPETIRGILRQRLRWSQGGSEAMIKNINMFSIWRLRRMWPVCIEFFVSILWSYTMVIIIMLWLLGKFIALPPALYIDTLIPGWNGVILGITCLLQFAVSFAIDGRYEKGISRYYYWIIWYPLAYWALDVLTTVISFPRAIFKERGRRARWKSYDRGLRP